MCILYGHNQEYIYLCFLLLEEKQNLFKWCKMNAMIVDLLKTPVWLRPSSPKGKTPWFVDHQTRLKA